MSYSFVRREFLLSYTSAFSRLSQALIINVINLQEQLGSFFWRGGGKRNYQELVLCFLVCEAL